MKNEGPYLREWIEYHRIHGVEKFYLYDNESNDDTKKILAPYIKSGLVEYTYFPGEKQQLPAYADCLARHRNDAKWLAIIDLDEFIVPKKHNTISEMLNHMPRRVSEVVIKWAIYGSNGHEKMPRGLVMENYTMRAEKSWLRKAIVRPNRAFSFHVHESDVAGRIRYLSLKQAQVNHYHCKSWAEYQERQKRGDVYRGYEYGIKDYNREKFDRHDKNEVYDDCILKYVPAVKRAMKK